MELLFTLEDNLWWTTTAIFPWWKEFQSRSGVYGAQDPATPSDGFVRIVFAPEGRGNELLTDSEKSSIGWVRQEALFATAATRLRAHKCETITYQTGRSGSPFGGVLVHYCRLDEVEVSSFPLAPKS